MSAMPRSGLVIRRVGMWLSSVHRLADHAAAAGRKGHDTAHLLDFQLFAGPAQAFAERAQRRHHRTARHAIAHGTPPSAALAPSLTAGPAVGPALAGNVGWGLYQALG